MKVWIGKSLIIIGLIHSIFGFIFFHGIISKLVQEKLFNTINQQPDRNAAFWFLFSGFIIIIIGFLIDWIEHKNIGMPFFLKWSFLVLTIIGCFIMPLSGFWLLIIPLIGLFLRGNKEFESTDSL